MLVQLLFLVICHSILADPLPKPSYDVEDFEVVGHHFEKFIQTYKKQYDKNEKPMRFNIFTENLKEINRLNEKYTLATFDISKFADLTKAEQRSLLGFGVTTDSDVPIGNCKLTDEPTSKDAPDAWDWRDKNVVSPVKNQRRCGSCWAFSATGLVESRSLQNGKPVILSEQQLVDCDKSSTGCNGGYMTWALTDLMQQGGQESDADYPYEAKDNSCRFDNNKIAAIVANCSAYALTGEGPLKELLYKTGPLSVGVQADAWLFYKTGILTDCDFRVFDHGVLLVGYGNDNGKDFWVIKNSWGADWGEQGFIRILRGTGCCGIANKDPQATVSANVQ